MATKTSDTVFTYGQMNVITNTASTLVVEAMNKMAFHMTEAEFIEAFIRPDHIKQLEEVYELIGGQRAEERKVKLLTNAEDPTDPKARLMADIRYVGDGPKFLVPHYVTTELRYFTEAGKRVTEWAAERRRIGILLADGLAALEWLNEKCGNARAFGLMFPALGSIMTRTSTNPEDTLVKKGRAMGTTKTLGKLPVLPREVVSHIRDASSMFQALLLTGDAKVNVPPNTCASLYGVPSAYLSAKNADLYARPHITKGASQIVRNFL